MHLLMFALAAAIGVEPNTPKIDFSRQIRPILAENCFHCHGPDDKARKAKLRLDTKDGLLGLVRGGEAKIVHPGIADKSELAVRLAPKDMSELMPPAKSGKKLTPAEVRLVRDWIDQGAVWSDHWAFIPPKRPDVPAADPKWVRNPIDNFILARLVKEKMSPSPEADRVTLIRRLSLDLTGLPPTPREVDAFLADKSKDAYEKVVDRLLASKHHGERMAMNWLDYARFADSNGFQVDSGRSMWPWRDWVIDAYNRNMPFDQFTIQQLAGDLLPDATPSQIVATGFHRNHRLNGEGGLIGEEWRVENIVDRVDTTGLTWLGLTFGCARCHDHRFDPIRQKDYYQLFAFFNNIAESGTLAGNRAGGNTDPVITIPSAEQEAEIARLNAEIKAAEAALAKASTEATAAQLAELEAALRKQVSANGATWSPFDPAKIVSAGGATFTKLPDGTHLVGGPNPQFDTYTVTGPLAAGPFSGILLECLPDDSLPAKSLGRFSNGNFVLTKLEAEITAGAKKTPIAIARVDADYSQPDWNIQNVLGKNPAKGWAVDGPTRPQPCKALFVASGVTDVPAGATLTVKLDHRSISQHNIGRFRLATASAPPGLLKIGGTIIPEAVKLALLTDAAQRTPAQTAELTAFLKKNVVNPAQKERESLAALRKQLTASSANQPNVMVMKEGPVRDAFILLRGQYDKRGEKVTAGLPAVFGSLPAGAPANRLGLARWIVDPANPLTSRVWVNRAWEHYFGAGLVKSSENLGSQADTPSHPELLDWLATEFVATGWDMKAMHKTIVMSAAYRQSSRITPALRERDPDNRLLARASRFRLPGELVRDQALFVGGLMTPKIGGPSVRPYMPPGVWDETSVYGDLLNYRADKGDNLYRRTMYTIWKRTAAPPTMLLLDAPSREICSVKRSRTNTPLQALALLNEVTYVEAARKLAERMMTEGGATPAERLTYGFRVAAGRTPSPRELKVLHDGFDADIAKFREDQASAKKLLGIGDSPPAPTLDVPELAAYTLTANVLLNLDEVLTRE